MTKCLNFHARYRCRSTGACCSAGWTIPFTGKEFQGVSALPLTPGVPFRALSDGTRVAGVRKDGTCAFLEDGTHLCEIHRLGGHGALPLTCRMFPRVVLHDPRGTFVSLSHFCPTAAAMLFEPGPVGIVDAPSTLTNEEPLDGLDARKVWPPLLRRGMLMDLESYDTWERLGVEVLTREGIPPRASLDALDAATTGIAAWSPGRTPLRHVVFDAFAALSPATAVLEDHDPAVKRWLAARLFGSWIAYQGEGLATIVRYLRACLDAFTIELARDRDALQAIRRSDRLIIHESSSQKLATLLNA
jgi:Fe-S-cluster containining protein